MDMIKFQFTKVYYTTKELLELIPIPRATFYRMHREEIEAEMSMVPTQLRRTLIQVINKLDDRKTVAIGS